MKKLINIVLFMSLSLVADNEISVTQSGNSATIDLEQQGGSNLIGGTSAETGSMTALDLDGVSMILDINQIGASNVFRSDAIDGDNFTGFFEFTGDSNVFDILMDSTGLIDSDYINMNINAINYVDVNGSSNTINFSGSGYAGTTSADSGYFYLDLDGSSNTLDITQSSTLARDYIKLITNTSNSNICISQNDQGTSTSC